MRDAHGAARAVNASVPIGWYYLIPAAELCRHHGLPATLTLRDAKEQMVKMGFYRLVVLGLLAAFALAAVAAPSTQAVSAPYWNINGTRLVAGRTHNYDVRGYPGHTFALESKDGIQIDCLAEIDSGVLLGSNPGEAGKDEETATFTDCMAAGNGEPCGLANEKGEPTLTLSTLPLKSKLVENVEGGVNGKRLLEVLLPATGNAFARLHFVGEACFVKEIEITGQTASEVLLDRAGEEKVELGQTQQQSSSWLIRFPTTPIRSVWLVLNGVEKVTTTGLSSTEAEWLVTGVALMLLANTKFAPEFDALWSPLP
jgi:hypothetical protein